MEYRTIDALCGIYKIVNKINMKVYIGQSINIKQRWKDHIRVLNQNKSRCTLLQRAWNKYGEENFSFEILELCTEDMLDEIEIKYINIYDSISNGYNIETGGNKNKCLSDTTKQLLSEAHLGKIMSNETRQKMSKSRMGVANGMYGKRHTEESKKKMSKSKKGKKGRPNSDYQRECARIANLGKTLSEETKRKISEANMGNTPHNKNLHKVYCVELNRVFDNPTVASKELNISSSNIIACCKHVRKTCGGYHWEYLDTIGNTSVCNTNSIIQN